LLSLLGPPKASLGKKVVARTRISDSGIVFRAC
jgi:hypothetical protein